MCQTGSLLIWKLGWVVFLILKELFKILVVAFFELFFIVASTFKQMLTITLDESDCFAAWVSAKDAGFSSSDGSDPKRKQSHLNADLMHRS